jgi:hypothetical protein
VGAEGPLLEAVIAMTSGQCPEQLFEQALQENCKEQMPELGETYKKLGLLQSVRFEGIKPLPGFEGRSSESYTIIFANGSWLWYLDVAANGKLAMLWAPDRPLMKQLKH